MILLSLPASPRPGHFTLHGRPDWVSSGLHTSSWTLFLWLSCAGPALIKHQAEQIPKSTSAQVSIPEHQFAARNVLIGVGVTQENSTFQSLFWG